MIEFVRQVPNPPPEIFVGSGNTVAARRCFVWGGPPLAPALPTAGGRIDGVSIRNTVALAVPGLPVHVEAGAAFGAGVDLEVDAAGRVIERTTGVIVARALEAAAGAGSFVQVVIA